jgi:IS30 family transposase
VFLRNTHFGKAGMPRRSDIFTPAAVRMIRRLAEQGQSAAEIAEAIGSTPGSVRVKCCRLKIRLRRARGRSSERQHRFIRGKKLEVSLPPAVYADLKRKAHALHKTADDLAGGLLEAVVTSNIYDAVLDENDSGI